MKINLIKVNNSINPNETFLKDSETFIEDLNNELFEYDHELVYEITDSPFSIVFIETGGAEQKFVKIYKKLKKPIILLSNCKNNSLAACFEIKTFLEKENIAYSLLFGEEKSIAASIDKISKLTLILDKMNKAKLGVIGSPSDWLIASKISKNDIKSGFNFEIVNIDMDEFYNEIEDGNIDIINNLKELKMKWKDENILLDALKIYSALKRLVKKYNLQGLTLRCFDLIQKYKNTACLAFAILNSEGIVATCEGDVPTLLTMYMIKEITNLPSFQANPSKIDLKDNSMIFSHCTIPLNMCKNYSLDTHFESGIGIGVKGELENKDVTIFKIAPNLKSILLLNGKIISNESNKNYCRTQVKIKFNDDDIYEIISEPFGNHVCIVYGDIINELLPFLQFYRFLPNNIH